VKERPSLQGALDALESMTRAQLLACWQECFGRSAPRLHAPFLRRGIAWQLQLRAEGWTPAKVGKLLKSAGTRVPVAPGATLVREWQGRTYTVMVLAEGFAFDGKTYKSLTAIAREITGTPWSGPQFFGLRT
jgi:hypothetical protein